MAKVSITPCAVYEPEEVRRALIAALSPLGGLSFIKPGMRIGIKMNLITLKQYQSAATTHPVVLAELSRLIREQGATPVIGDSPGGPFTGAFLRSCYGPTGLKLAEEAGAELNLNTEVSEAAFPEGKVLKRVTHTAWLDDCDAVITCAKLKTHGMLGMTGATKNQFGIIPGLMKPEYHSLYPEVQDFCDMLIDLNEYLKPRLAIIDGVICMEGNGPTAGTPREIGCLIASDSVYHADVAMAHIMGLSPASMPLIHAAYLRGLAPERVEELEIVGDPEKYRMTDFRNIEIHGVQFGGRRDSVLQQLVNQVLARHPQVDAKKCVNCGICARTCPKDAITIRRKPKFNLQACIRCFCCQEMCPKEAISVKTTWVSKLLK